MGNRREYLINNIVETCHRLDRKGFVANHDGNITVRYDDHLLATPTAINKSSMCKELVITLDMQGNKIQGIGKPFSELSLHLAAYTARTDVQAVIHAHPPFTMARGLLAKSLTVNIPEAIVSIGHIIPVTRFFLPNDPEQNQIINQILHETDTFIIPGNGIIAIGDNVEQAYLRLELVEHIAKIDYYANTMGQSISLPDDIIKKLLEKRSSLGLGPNKLTKTIPTSSESNHTLNEIIAKEVKNVLLGK